MVLVNRFPNHFSFSVANRKNSLYLHNHLKSLDDLLNKHTFDTYTAVVIADVSIKNNTVTAVSHTLSKYRDIIRIVYHVFNVITTEAKLFTIRSGINQACQISDVKKVHIITNSIYAAKHIFDFSVHLYQTQSITAAQDLRIFFNRSSNNSVKFWEYSSKAL